MQSRQETIQVEHYKQGGVEHQKQGEVEHQKQGEVELPLFVCVACNSCRGKVVSQHHALALNQSLPARATCPAAVC